MCPLRSVKVVVLQDVSYASFLWFWSFFCGMEMTQIATRSRDHACSSLSAKLAPICTFIPCENDRKKLEDEKRNMGVWKMKMTLESDRVWWWDEKWFPRGSSTNQGLPSDITSVLFATGLSPTAESLGVNKHLCYQICAEKKTRQD